MLNTERADDRDSWLYVGWALNGVNEGFLPIWKEFSKRSADKYDENVCDYQWNRMVSGGPRAWYGDFTLYGWHR